MKKQEIGVLQTIANSLWWICTIKQTEDHLFVFGDGLPIMKCKKTTDGKLQMAMRNNRYFPGLPISGSVSFEEIKQALHELAERENAKWGRG